MGWHAKAQTERKEEADNQLAKDKITSKKIHGQKINTS